MLRPARRVELRSPFLKSLLTWLRGFGCVRSRRIRVVAIEQVFVSSRSSRYSCRRDRAAMLSDRDQTPCDIRTKQSSQTAKRQQNISRPRLLRIAAVGVRVSACRVSLVACSSVITLWLTGIVFGDNLRRIGGECHDAPAGRLPAAAGARLGALA